MVTHSLTRLRLVFCCIASAVVIPKSTAQHNRIPNVDHHYPVHIGAEGHIVQGRVSSEAEVGALVSSNVIVEGSNEANATVHLRVEVRKSIYMRKHLFYLDHTANSSAIEEFPNSSLPYGMKLVVIHTKAFYVNEDRYITVNDFSNLNGETRIHFDIILKDTLAEKYVSNQLHFVVDIDYPTRQMNPNAVLFAGVLVLTIVSISLLIPFVVRAKRRCKAGKPIFRCGSADDGSDIESFGPMPDHLQKRANSIGGKDNLAMILDGGRIKNPRPSIDQHTTIQNHMLRSTSGFQFQPRCMDPHYNDIYERPDFSRFATPIPAEVKENGTQGARPTFTHGSYRKSASSEKIYPDNFNKDVSKNTPSLAEAAGGGSRKGDDFPRKVNDVLWKMNDVPRKEKSGSALNGGTFRSLVEPQTSNSCSNSSAMSRADVQNMNGAQENSPTVGISPYLENEHL